MDRIQYIPILNEMDNTKLNGDQAMKVRNDLSNRSRNSLNPNNNDYYRLEKKKTEAGRKAAIEKANQEARDQNRSNDNQRRIDDKYNKEVYGAKNAELIKKEDSLVDKETEFSDDFIDSLDTDSIDVSDILLEF